MSSDQGSKSPKDKTDAIFHPVRMRIVQILIGRPLTAHQLGRLLPDVPPATLYRHLKRLLSAGIVTVVEERQVRGAVERTYSVPPTAASLTAADVANASREQHVAYFGIFLAGLLADFRRYVRQDVIDFGADGVGYRMIVLNLTDEEFRHMAAAVNAAVAPFLANGPSPKRKRRLFASVTLPAGAGKGTTRI